MISWINEAFGSGKSTLAAGLHGALPGSVMADPDEIGDLLRRTLNEHPGKLHDYQDPGHGARSEAARAHRRRWAADYAAAGAAWMHADAHLIDTSALTPEAVLDAALTRLLPTHLATADGVRP
ncbi:hypothetical protein ABZ766_02975 [Streptomyces sp. NPDC006670]|uniref:hypothetical protein n=1 Tax=Streptomyces sp. NPDC006670 TaxID=3154476 RepID=UPI0033DA7992